MSRNFKTGDIYAEIDGDGLIELSTIRKDMNLAWFYDSQCTLTLGRTLTLGPIIKDVLYPCASIFPPCKTFYNLRVNWRKIGKL